MRWLLVFASSAGCTIPFPLEAPTPVAFRASVTTQQPATGPTISIARPGEVVAGDTVVIALSGSPITNQLVSSDPPFEELWNHRMEATCFNKARLTLLYTTTARDEEIYSFTFVEDVAMNAEMVLIAYGDSQPARAIRRDPIVNSATEELPIAIEGVELAPTSFDVLVVHSNNQPPDPESSELVNAVDDLRIYSNATEAGAVPPRDLTMPGQSCADIAELVFEPR